MKSWLNSLRDVVESRGSWVGFAVPYQVSCGAVIFWTVALTFFIAMYLRNIRLLLRCWFGIASECSRGRVRSLTAILMRWKCVPLGSVQLCIGKDVPGTGGERWLCWNVTGRCWVWAELTFLPWSLGMWLAFIPDQTVMILSCCLLDSCVHLGWKRPSEYWKLSCVCFIVTLSWHLL